jgi:undecaprenyl-diphosphatase
VAGLVIGTAAVLFARRRIVEPLALMTGFALVVLGIHMAKAGVDRPRPSHSDVGTTGSSFPSGHAAYSAAWVAVAVVYTRPFRLAGRASFVLVAIVISAAVGVSRIYLRAHFWSDVAGGWGLGYGIFGMAAVAALVVAYVRHNEKAGTPSTR